MPFIQIIEFQTSRFDDVLAALDAFYDASAGKRSGVGSVGRDRDRAGHYAAVIEFDSAEAAEANNALPEVQAMSGKLAELCDGPPTFTNLDVVRRA